MLNYLWLGLVVLAVIIGGVNGQLPAVTAKAFEACKNSVMEIALPLIGLMALWLGIMRLAEKSGIVYIIARALRPLMHWLFPDVPSNHPAIGSIVMNMAANMLGLGNSATPLGLKAMQELEKLNPRTGVATNAMCTFLAINTSSIQLIPMTAVAILAVKGASNPSAIIVTSLLATICSTIAGISAVKFLEKLPWYQLPPVTNSEDKKLTTENTETEDLSTSQDHVSIFGKCVLFLFFVAFFYIGYVQWKAIATPGSITSGSFYYNGALVVSELAIPFLLAFFPLYAALKRVPVYEEFVEGAKEGFQVGVRIIPYLIAILVAIGMFRAAGGIDLISRYTANFFSMIGFPIDLLPLALVRPLSGSGATGIFTEIVMTHGPDSLIARMAGTIMGSTETTFYVIALYFGSVAIKRTRHAVPAGLFADIVGIVAAVIICNFFFR